MHMGAVREWWPTGKEGGLKLSGRARQWAGMHPGSSGGEMKQCRQGRDKMGKQEPGVKYRGQWLD